MNTQENVERSDSQEKFVTGTSPGKRISVSLPEETARLLEAIANNQGISQNEAIRRAIATEAYLRQAATEGYKFLLQNQEKEIREIVFR